ncbi:hypothetical protein Tco_0947415 [Tanacetum coccineum]
MHTVRGDGVAGIKRHRRDLSGDGVWNLATASGRGRLKEDLESSTWRRLRCWSIKRKGSYTSCSKSLIEDRGDEVVLSMLLVDFKNVFNLVDREVMLQEVRIRCLAISRWAWYLDDDTIVGDTLVVREVLKVIMEDGPCRGLHLNVDKTEVFWLKDEPRSRFAGVFLQNIARPLHGVKLLCGPASANFDFSSELVMKRVSKSIMLMDTIAKLNDPQCELLLLRACAGISKLYFTMRICSPRVFKQAQRSFDAALHSSLERIVSASGPGFGDWQWRLSTLPFAFGGLVSTSRVMPAFDNALNAFNAKM